MISEELVQSSLGIEGIENGIEFFPALAYLRKGIAVELFHIAVENEGVVLFKVVIPEGGDKKFSIGQKIIPRSVIADMKVTEDNYSAAVINLNRVSFEKELIQFSAVEFRFHQVMIIN
jgi:hypothetical protein